MIILSILVSISPIYRSKSLLTRRVEVAAILLLKAGLSICWDHRKIGRAETGAIHLFLVTAFFQHIVEALLRPFR